MPPWWGAGRARWAIALVALLAVSIGGLNLWPGALVRVAFLCSAPGLSSLIPCNRVVTGTPGVPPTVAEDPVPTRVLTSSSQLAAAIATVGQAGSGTLSVGEGVFEIQAPVVLSGHVTIRGVAPERSVLRLVSATGGILYRGDGTLSIADIGIVLVTSGAGDVLTIGGGTARLERIAVTGGRPGGGVAGAGLVFVGGATGSARDCIVQANEFGVWIANQATPSISRCTIASNLARGVSFHGDSGGELIGNTIEGNGYARTRDDHWQGVALQESAAPSIRDNTIRDNAGIGVQYRDTSGGNFSGNRVSGNGWNIQRYADATASAGGLAIGTRNTNHQPTPTIGSGNTYSNNYGGNVIDYR